MFDAPRVTAGGLFFSGVIMLVLSLVFSFVSSALYGPQTSDLMASLPGWLLSFAGWLPGISLHFAGPLIVGGLVVRALRVESRADLAAGGR